jgi:S1-C subfamily serine protease
MSKIEDMTKIEALEKERREEMLRENEMKECKKKHEEILWVTVRIKAEKAWGSGTVIYSGKDAEGVYHTYVLTCHHVVADNIKVDIRFDSRVGYDIKKETRIPAEVEFFYYNKLSICQGVSGSMKADIVAYDVDGDTALLKLRRDSKVDFIANLFPKGKEAEVHVFDEVWACGAALAHEPIATHGIINFMNELIDEGVEYWMSSAQIIFGNSGGGIFRYSRERGKYEYLGIPARMDVSISGFSSSPITHMGFFVPIPRIYRLLEENSYQFIYDEAYTIEQCDKLREDYKKEQEKLLVAKFGGVPEKEKRIR